MHLVFTGEDFNKSSVNLPQMSHLSTIQMSLLSTETGKLQEQSTFEMVSQIR